MYNISRDIPKSTNTLKRRETMKQRFFVLLTAVLVLLLALSLFGCEKQDSENNQQTNEDPENVIVEKETTD